MISRRAFFRNGAVAPWSRRTQIFYHQLLAGLSSHYRFSLDVPFGKLAERVRNLVLFGSSGEPVRFALEEDAALLTGGKWDWVDGRQESFYLIKP